MVLRASDVGAMPETFCPMGTKPDKAGFGFSLHVFMKEMKASEQRTLRKRRDLLNDS